MLEKEVKKYVIATFDQPTLYLKSLHWGEYCFLENIEGATKFLSKKLALDMVGYYHSDTGLDTTLVVVPVKISYELVEKQEE